MVRFGMVRWGMGVKNLPHKVGEKYWRMVEW